MHQLGQIRFVEGFDPRRQRCVAQDENRRAVFARDADRFDRDVETILHARCGEHDARAVAVAAEDRLDANRFARRSSADPCSGRRVER